MKKNKLSKRLKPNKINYKNTNNPLRCQTTIKGGETASEISKVNTNKNK